MEYDCKKITEKLTNTLNKKVDKDIEAIVWLDKQGGIEFEIFYTGYVDEALICSGFLSNENKVEFYRKSSILPLSETTNLTPYQITKTKKLIKKILEEWEK
jgi:hypothetical protein